MEKAAEHSCLGSIHTEISKTGYIQEVSASGVSRNLSREETAHVLSQIRPGDCDKTNFDPAQIHISINDEGGDTNGVRIWTDGRDGLSGTNDDLVMPIIYPPRSR